MDWNVQCDTQAAQVLAATTSDLTLVTLSATLKAHLRAADLPRLRASGPLGALLTRQGQAHGEYHQMAELGRAHAGLPDDLVNFHHDPVACAVVVGWAGAGIQELRLQPVMEGELLRFQPDQDGRLMRVVVDLDGPSCAAGSWRARGRWPAAGCNRRSSWTAGVSTWPT